MQAPSIGRIVHYKLSEGDVLAIDRQHPRTRPSGNCHRNAVRAGDIYPALVVRTFEGGVGTVNLAVSVDGDCTYWATSRTPGDEAGHWFWPPRV